jgi:hypothetical protein
MNLLHLPDKYHISILDGGVDTCVLGQGWQVQHLLFWCYEQNELSILENNTPINQQTKQELDQTRFTFADTFVDLGVWVLIN